jgi:hypothetical protein
VPKPPKLVPNWDGGVVVVGFDPKLEPNAGSALVPKEVPVCVTLPKEPKPGAGDVPKLEEGAVAPNVEVVFAAPKAGVAVVEPPKPEVVPPIPDPKPVEAEGLPKLKPPPDC